MEIAGSRFQEEREIDICMYLRGKKSKGGKERERERYVKVPNFEVLGT